MNHITDFKSYGRRHGLRALDLLIQQLPEKEKETPREAYSQLQSSKVFTAAKKNAVTKKDRIR